MEEPTEYAIIKKNIPESELWLFEDREALEDVLTGLKEVAEGKISQNRPGRFVETSAKVIYLTYINQTRNR